MKNGEIKEVVIDGITNEGNGVGRVDSMAVFVPESAVGDRLRVRIEKVGKSFAVGKAVKILDASSARVPPDCPCFSECGGCAFRHISYGEELKIKRRFVEDAFARIGKINHPVENVLSGNVDGYRNKAQYPVSADGKVGFFAARSHRIIPCNDCRLQPPVFSDIARAFELFTKQFNISVYNEQTGKGLLRHLYIRTAANGDIMVTVVINGAALPHSDALISVLSSLLGERFKSFILNINREKTNVILGNECRILYGDGFITDALCGVSLRVSPLSFSQVNHDMAERLYKKAAEYAEPDGKTVIDLYCGTGAIGLTVARRAKSVIGVEIVPEAVADARVNAEQNGIENARFICADAAKAATELKKQGIKSDVVIVDPPRKGCDKALLSIIANDFCPERLVYVSCDPATLARDCKELKELGYEVEEITPVDLFPRTTHVETVVRLGRKG